MDKRTLKALKESIKKWEKIVAGKGGDRGGGNCALCELFAEEGCIDCPVYIKTGKCDCSDTPYVEWHDHQTNNHFDGFSEIYKIECPKCKELAQKELEFLKSLLPEKEGE